MRKKTEIKSWSKGTSHSTFSIFIQKLIDDDNEIVCITPVSYQLIGGVYDITYALVVINSFSLI